MPNCFPNWLYQQCMRFSCSTSSPTLGVVVLFILASWNVSSDPSLLFNCISQMINDVKHLLMRFICRPCILFSVCSNLWTFYFLLLFGHAEWKQDLSSPARGWGYIPRKCSILTTDCQNWAIFLLCVENSCIKIMYVCYVSNTWSANVFLLCGLCF